MVEPVRSSRTARRSGGPGRRAASRRAPFTTLFTTVVAFVLATLVVAGTVPPASAETWAVVTDPTISGTAKVGQTLTVNPGSTSPASAATYVQWYRNGYSIGLSGTRTPTYTLTGDDAGQAITVIVTYQRYSYDATYTMTRTAGPVVVANGTFTAYADPTISGTPVVGNTVTAAPGSVSPAASTLTYQWLRNGSPLRGATSTSYDLTADDAGTQLAVQVTAASYGYDPLTRTSVANTVAAGTLQATTAPALSGAPVVGGTLQATPGTTAPAASTVSYQWFRNGSPAPGQVGPRYTLAAADVGARISVSVTSTSVGYDPLTAVLTAPTTVASGTFRLTRPASVSGRRKVGRKLTAHPAALSPTAVKVTYQWLRNGKVIARATTATYKLTRRDHGTKVRVKITYITAGFTPLQQTLLAARRVR